MVRPIAQKTYDAVMMDSGHMLSCACLIDFGMEGNNDDFTARFGALQNAARNGATPEDFDTALGNSKKLTELVQKYGSDVVFPPTVWDVMGDGDEEDEEDPEYDAYVDQLAQFHEDRR